MSRMGQEEERDIARNRGNGEKSWLLLHTGLVRVNNELE